MMANSNLTIYIANSAEFSAEVKSLQQSLFEDLANVSLEVRELFIHRFNSLVEVACIDADIAPAISANKYGVTLKFSDSFIELLRAFRAGELNVV